MNKSEIRNTIKQQLSEINDDQFKKLCRQIYDKVVQTDIWKDSTTIGLTISRGREIDTYALVKSAWEVGKRVAVPRCNRATNQLTFYQLDSFGELEETFYGLLEPKQVAEKVVESNDMSLIVVPGLAFDHEGYRVGFGGGYYDRYLAKYNHQTLSMALPFQVYRSLPHEKFDIPVSQIITTEQIINTRK